MDDDRDNLLSRLDAQGSSALLKHLSLGMWALCAEAAADIRLLQACLNERDKFLVDKGLWMEFVDSIPAGPNKK